MSAKVHYHHSHLSKDTQSSMYEDDQDLREGFTLVTGLKDEYYDHEPSKLDDLSLRSKIKDKKALDEFNKLIEEYKSMRSNRKLKF